MDRIHIAIFAGLAAASCGGRTIGTSQSTGSEGSLSNGSSSSSGAGNPDGSSTGSATCSVQSGVCVSCGNGTCNYNGTIFPFCSSGIEGGSMCTGPRDCIACDGSGGTRWQCLGQWLDLNALQCSP
jgi:hypothetical protein